MNSRRSARFKKRQHETIGNLCIVIIYFVSEYCDNYLTFGQGSGNSLQTSREVVRSYFSFYIFLENYALLRYGSLDNFCVLIARIFVLQFV